MRDLRRRVVLPLLAIIVSSFVGVVLVENAGRFARDLAVQLTGHALLQGTGIELVPVDAPSYFIDPSPTAELVRQILGAVSQFEKAALVAKLRTGSIGGAQGFRCEEFVRPKPRRVIVNRRSDDHLVERMLLSKLF